jgi:acetolactate synthase-1/2/3 large subunit
MSESAATVARVLAETLVELGVKRVYGLPGEDHMGLLDAVQKAGLDYRTAFNESSAVLMAATEAQVSGLPGVVILSLAPGVSNGLNGLLNAYLDEIPLIVISGQHPAGHLPFVIRQGFDLDALVAPMTTWRARVTADMNIARLIGRAVDESITGRRGPVYLEIPAAVADAPAVGASEAAATVARLSRRIATRTAAAPDQGAVELLRTRLAAASHPALVVAGRQGRLSPQTVEAFSTHYRVPVFTSPRRKGTVHSGTPFYAGTFLNGRIEGRLLDNADLVVLVDPESHDFYNRPWCFSARSIALVTQDFAEWGNPLDDVLIADPELTLSAVLGSGLPTSSEWTTDDVSAYRDGLRASLLGPGTNGFSVAQAIAAALDPWPRDGWLVADAGFGKPLVAMLSDPVRPGRFLASHALSTMGYAIPASVVARRSGTAPVLTFLGDGSLLMRASELAVDAGEGGPWVIVALMDRSLTQIEVKQERQHLATVGVALPDISCAKLADAFGVDGIDVATAGDLRAAVAKGATGSRPLLVGAHIDPAPSRELFELLRG